jgi:hypothetical protein
MKLILHIGTIKTGTTTAQNWLANNRAALSEFGVWYPEIGNYNHSWLPNVIATDPNEGDERLLRYGISTLREYGLYRERLIGQFSEELAGARKRNIHTAIISSEHLQHRLTSNDTVARVRAFAENYFSAVEIVVYLRPQVDLIVSSAATASKLGKRIDTDWFSTEASKSPDDLNYDRLIDRWERAFGPENVRCLAYRSAPNFADYVIDRFAIDRRRTSIVETVNRSLSVEQLALANCMVDDAGQEKDFTFITAQIPFPVLPAGAKLSIGRELANRLQSKFSPSNALLAARRSDIALEDLEPDWSRYQRPSNLSELDAQSPFSAEIRALAKYYNRVLQLERTRIAVLECYIAAAQFQPKRAHALLEHAIKTLEAGGVTPGLEKDEARVAALVGVAAEKLGVKTYPRR